MTRFKHLVVCCLLLGIPLFAASGPSSEPGAPNSAGAKSSPPAAAAPAPAASPAAPEPAPAPAMASGGVMDSLLNLMVAKGVLTSSDLASLKAAPAGQQVNVLVGLLKQKGVISDADAAALSSLPAAPSPTPNAFSVASGVPATYSSDTQLIATAQTSSGQNPQNVTPQGTGTTPKTTPPPTFIAAVAPIRVLPIDPPKHDGLIPDIKVGPVKLKPYGFLKASVVEDSSQPRGDDFPLPGFLFGDTGPAGAPEFHVKARSSRFGNNFEWLDPSPRVTVTGRIEFDFEGNYSAADNRNISSARSNMPSLRLAWSRVDFATTDRTTIYGVFGQDWTPFGSSTLPNTLETTGVGIAFGSLYERAPQVRMGVTHAFGSGTTAPKLLFEAAGVMPQFGNVPSATNFQIPGTNPGNNTNVVNVIGTGGTVIGTVTIPQVANTGLGLQNQLAFGERQGADSNRPEVEGRLAFQWQLDHAKGVQPAQIIVSGVQGERDAIVTSGLNAANIPTVTGTLPAGVLATAYKTAFAHGVTVNSQRYGANASIQLPTRFVTFLASWYRGADLRWFFAGQLFSNYNNAAGLTNTATIASIDGSAAVVFGLRNGVPTIAPQEPVRTQGGFAELGLPLSRWFHADPAGRNAGWTMNLHYGLDDANANDVRKAAPTGGRDKSDWAFGNLQYKMNNWVTFGFEEGLYRTRALPNATTGLYTGTIFEGVPTREWKDLRSELATIFTF